MSPLDLLPAGVLLLDLAGGLLVAGYTAAALVTLGRRDLAAARRLVADGAVLGLSLKTAGSLLRILDLPTWERVGLFAAVLTLRLLLKQLFIWERGRLADGRPGPGQVARRDPA